MRPGRRSPRAAQIASEYLLRALAEPAAAGERAEILFELGAAEALTATSASTEHLEEALRLETEPGKRTTIATLLARGLFLDGRPSRAVEVCRQALDDLPDGDREQRARLEYALMITATFEPGLATLAESLAGRARAMIGAEGFGAKALLAVGTYHDAAGGAEPAEVVMARVKEALSGGVLMSEEPEGLAVQSAAAVAAMSDSDLALEVHAAGLEAALRTGDALAVAQSNTGSCFAHLMRGELLDAIAHGEESLAAHTGISTGLALPYICAFLGAALIEHGDLPAAERTVEQAGDPDGIPGGHAYWLLSSRAQLRIARADLREGLEETMECGRRFEAVGGRNRAFIPWRSRAALCLTQLGEEPGLAQELVAQEVELARAWGVPRAVGLALRAQGLVTGGEEGLEILTEAVETLDGSPARLELGRALTDLGAALRRANMRRDARARLRRGMDLAHACAATPLRERARRELRAAGARPRRFQLTGPASLTPSERRVAEMAADGLTNREIAERLFVTPKTVEVHLSSSYRKLEIDSRRELSAALEATTA